MYKFKRNMENVGAILIVVVIVGFLIGFGYLVKTELIDRDFSTETENDNTSKKENKEEVLDKEESKKEEIEKKDEVKKEDTKKEEPVINTVDKNEDNEMKKDDVQYKSYPSVVCTLSEVIPDTKINQSESFKTYFNNDGTLRWIEYSYVMNFKDDVESYNELYKAGYFDELYKEFSSFADINLYSTSFKIKYEIDQDKYLELDDCIFKNKNEMKFDSLKKIFKNNGYSCSEE